MATRVQLRRGTTLQNDAFTGAVGELTYDTTSKGMRIHDGSTQGGTLVDTVVSFIKPTAGNNYSWARVYASGWVEQGGVTQSGSVAQTVTLLVPMSQYTIMITGMSNDLSSLNNVVVCGYEDVTTTGFTVRGNVVNKNSQTSADTSAKSWYACGMAL